MRDGKPLTLSIGEILWDMLPTGKLLGGAPCNVAWHLAQFGAEARVVTAVGDDDQGREIAERLKAMRMNLDTMAVLPDKPTSTVDATLGPDGSATYVIHENVAPDFLPVTPLALSLAGKARAVNFGSLAQRSPVGRKSTLALLDATPADCIRVFDINLRPPFINKDVLLAGFARAAAVKMNDDEIEVLAGMFGWPEGVERRIEALFGAFPHVRHVIVTRGSKGAWWHNRERLFEKAPTGKVKVADTIGAGDSFTASVIAGLLKGLAVEAIMEAALAVAAFVCGRSGGTPELPVELKKSLMLVED